MNKKYVGFALSPSVAVWRFGWATPMEDASTKADAIEYGHQWLCLGPVALMFERQR